MDSDKAKIYARVRYALSVVAAVYGLALLAAAHSTRPALNSVGRLGSARTSPWTSRVRPVKSCSVDVPSKPTSLEPSARSRRASASSGGG